MHTSGSGGKVAIIGAIVTAIAGIVTAVITITGPLIDKKIAIQATQTREAVLAPITRVAGAEIRMGESPTPFISTPPVVEPTRTPSPPLPIPPTFTVVPMSETDPSPGGPPAGNEALQASPTPGGTLLRIGESVTSNGISVKLTDIEFPAGNEVHLHFTFTNQTQKVINLSLDHNRDVTLIDDQGNEYKWATAFTWEVSIYPGTSRNDEVKRRGDVSRAGYFIVKLEIPGLISAQWKE